MSTIICLGTQKRGYLLFNCLRSFPVFLFLSFYFCAHGQNIDRYAGVGGHAGYSGDGGLAISAKLSYPGRTATDKEGNLYIPDGNNHVVRKVAPTGIITTIAGTGAFGYSGDGGHATSAKLWFPNCVAIDNADNLYILCFNSSVVRKVDAAGIITTVAGNGTNGYSGDGNIATLAQLNGPVDVSIDATGNLYIADKYNKVVRKVNAAGIISTVAGNGTIGYTGDGGPATAAQFKTVDAVATDKAGNIYIADGQSSVIRKVNTSGIISTYAGTGVYGYSGDGVAATSARFAVNSPNDIAFDSSDNMYVADYQNHVIRKIDPFGIISTIAGIGQQAGVVGDGGPAISARMWFPFAIGIDTCTNLFITDVYNNTIRKITSSSAATVTQQPLNCTICENGNTSFSINAIDTDKYQWMVNKGLGWELINDDAIYSGCNTSIIHLVNVTMQMSNYQYRCIVSNACGPNYSAAANLVVNSIAAPTITITTPSTKVCNGTIVNFLANTFNAGISPGYQWKKNGVNVGTNSPGYSSNSINDGDIITCSLTATGCTTTTVTSNAITMSVNTAVTPSISITASNTKICTWSSITLTANALDAGTNPVYQWKKNGAIVGTNNAVYIAAGLTYSDIITCTLLTSNSSCSISPEVASNAITFSWDQAPPEVTIAASAKTICEGTNVTFTATKKSNEPTASYQWTVDGKDVGTNSTLFTTNTLTNKAVVECRMTVPGCTGGTTKDNSDPITMIVNPVLQPVISISSTATNICKGSSVTFSATPSDAGINPSYQWKINGSNTGTNSKTFTTTSLSDGDFIVCILTPDPSTPCIQGSNVASNAVTVKVASPLNTSVSIVASDNNFCGSKPITFSAVTQNLGTSPSYRWFVNGSKAGTDSAGFSYKPLNNDQVKLIIAAIDPGCSAPLTDTSNSITVSIKQVPGISLNPIDTTVAIGSQVQLRSTTTGSVASYTWTPAGNLTNSQTPSPVTLPISATTTYKLTAVSADGCVENKEAIIRVITALFMPNSFTPNGDGHNDIFRIPIGTSIKLKDFSIYNRSGMRIFSTSDVTKGWDGKYRDIQLDPGTFVFTIIGYDYQNKEVRLRGTVLLLR